MTPTVFAECMARIGANFGREVSKIQIDTYRRGLADLTDEEMLRATERVILHEKFWPNVATLREGAAGAQLDAGLNAWSSLRAELASHSGFLYAPASLYGGLDEPTKAAVRAVGGLRGVWETSDENYERIRGRFMRAYADAVLDARRTANRLNAAPVRQIAGAA